MTERSMMKFMIRGLALLGTGGALACGEGDSGTPFPRVDPIDVEVTEAVVTAGWESFPATIEADREAEVATRLSGTVREVYAEVGDEVRAGGPLVRLDDVDLIARTRSARAEAQLADRSLQRIQNLHADGAASTQELDEATAAAEAARARFGDAEAQQDYALVRAPFDGFVAARHAEPGDLAVPGRPLMRIVGQGGLEVGADLPGELAGEVAVGTEVVVRVPGSDVAASARVLRVVPALKAGSRRFRVEAVFDPPLPSRGAVVPGAYARVEIVRRHREGDDRWIPEDAVVRRGQLTGAFVLEGEELRLRWLRLGREIQGAVEVLAGPAARLTVVRNPGATLVDGAPTGSITRVDWAGPESGVTDYDPQEIPARESGP